jgi:pimeloyl-ACP methyl ester carboxylesterase
MSVMGLSVGGAAAIHAASFDPRIGAVVTVGAFAHPGDAMAFELKNRGMPRWAIGPFLRWIEWEVGFRFDDVAPEARIASVPCPVLLVHGGRDRVIPAEHGERLAAAGNSNVRILRLPEFGHSDCDRSPRFWPSVLRTLTSATKDPENA